VGTEILSKIISLGQELRNLNNFNTLMGIVAGLSMSAVNRLKNTFKGLDSKQAEVWRGEEGASVFILVYFCNIFFNLI
jgi:hypothetical protein